MTKYDFKLDLDTKNSISIIVEHIKDNTKILEFGSANGRLTKYLSENKNCIVDIVEISKESGTDAKRFANKALIGEIEGNIENYKWMEILKNEKYDYIIFADVLEHLYDPWKVLAKSKRFLKDDGSILISIPNIAHNSIIIDLLKDEFNYRELGLLDNTHIRFFTYNTLKEMILQAGLVSVDEQGVILRTFETEFGNNYDSIKSTIVKKYLKNREKGNIYQFVFELKKKEYYIERNPLVAINIDGKFSNDITIYVKDNEDINFTEGKTIRKKISDNRVKDVICLKSFKDIKSIRIDPSNEPCLVKLNHITLVCNGIEKKVNIMSHNANFWDDNYYIFFHEDPQFILEGINGVEGIDLSFEIFTYDIDILENISKIMKNKHAIENYMEKRIEELETKFNLENNKQKEANILLKNEMEQLKENLRNKIKEIEQKREVIKEKDREIEQREEIIEERERIIENIKKENMDKLITLDNIYNSRGWKYLTKIKRVFGK